MTAFNTLARTLPIAAAIGAAALLAVEPAAARGAGGHHGGGHVAAAGGWHGGHGHYRASHWGHRGYGRGAFWGGVGLGLGIGAIGYYGSHYGGHYGSYYGPYFGSYYYDEPVIVAPPIYRALEPRVGQPVPQVSSSPDPIFYPKNGQSAEATEADRRECNRWATTQRGAMADASIFQRATLACMEGRGYTVK
jgi:hypothetical protein